MERRTLGTAGLSVSALSLGCMGMSEFYGPTDEQESLATIDRALELGITMLDTADVYGPRTNEVLVGKAVKGRRDSVVIATKFGIVRTEDPQLSSGQRPAGLHQSELRRIAEAARCRHDRSLLPAPCRSRYPDRRNRRRDERARRRGQDSLHRPQRSESGNDSPRARRASDHGAADRILALHA